MNEEFSYIKNPEINSRTCGVLDHYKNAFAISGLKSGNVCKEHFCGIKEFIEKNNLKPATFREMPLFTLSCIAIGYSKLKSKLEYSYEAIGAIGGNGKFHTMFNEKYIIDETEKLVNNKKDSLNEIAFNPAKKTAEKILNAVNEVKDHIDKNPENVLKVISEIYEEYMLSIAIYNCFWRFIGNDFGKGKFNEDEVKRIGHERDHIASIYAEIEKLIKKSTKIIGEKNNFEGDLLRYFTSKEMKEYCSSMEIDNKHLDFLEKRRNGYFYLYSKEPFFEKIYTEENLLNNIRKTYFEFDKEINEVTGHVAYPGKVIGEVYNLKNHTREEIDNSKENYVIVASMTRPEDIFIIKRAKAIVTDEGGLLSHALIIARELKIPAIISTKIGSQIFRDGDQVEVDADKGVVKVLERAK